MPSLASSYLYTFFALTAVGALLVSTFSSFTVYLKQLPEEKKLENLTKYVASKCDELILASKVGNASKAELKLEMPLKIGTKHYWIRLMNGSSNAWVEGGFGTGPIRAIYKFYLVEKVVASGFFVCVSDKLTITCEKNGRNILLSLGAG